MPPRSLWTGAISFGLVNVPVKMFTAVRKKDVRFHQLEAGGELVPFHRRPEAVGVPPLLEIFHLALTRDHDAARALQLADELGAVVAAGARQAGTAGLPRPPARVPRRRRPAPR